MPGLDLGPPVLFNPGGSAFGAAVAAALGTAATAMEERSFEDGEHKVRPLADVRNRDVYVLAGLHGEPGRSVDEKLCRYLFFAATLKDAAAARVTLCAPYLCYARKDQQTKPHDPVTIRYLAQLVEATGTDRVIAMEVHNVAAFQNAFRIDTDHLNARGLFVERVLGEAGEDPLAVVSPDPGGMKRAELLREDLEARTGRPVAKGIVDKHRSQGVVTGDLFAGDVRDRTVVIVDDLISTGTTLRRAAAAARAHGARRVVAMATHGLFVGGAAGLMADPAIDRIVVTDTVPPVRVDPAVLGGRLVVLPAARLFAEAIRRANGGGGAGDPVTPGAAPA